MLILVPTELEGGHLATLRHPVAVCGFGLAEAGAGAAHAIATHPESAAGVILVGAAGTYHLEAYPVGTALSASAVRCDGIGAGGRTPAELGFGQPDVLELRGDGPEILSVTQASEAAAIAALTRRYPHAMAEEMEGYAVAVAARKFDVPLWIVRGISNVAGDRDVGGWRIGEAMTAAGALAAEIAG